MKWKSLLLGILLFTGLLANQAYAASSVETAGTAMAFLLPAAVGSYTLFSPDYTGLEQFVKSMTLNLGVTMGLKWSVDEIRPKGGSESFPSGHTSVSFCTAEFVRRRYGDKFGIPAYIIATFVGYSRVQSKEHWTHDVIAGAGIGILSSYLFTTPRDGWRVQVVGDSRSIEVNFSRSL